MAQNTLAQYGLVQTATAMQSLFASNYKLRLYTNNPTISISSQVADFTSPTFTGYADSNCTFSELTQDSAGNVVIQNTPLFFQPSGSTGLPQTIQGAIVFNNASSGAPALFFACPFDQPIQLGTTLSSATVQPQIACSNSQVWGGNVQVLD